MMTSPGSGMGSGMGNNPVLVNQADCISGVLLDPSTLPQLELLLSSSNVSDVLGLTVESVSYSFLWGFGAVFFFWYLGFQLSIVIKVIKRV